MSNVILNGSDELQEASVARVGEGGEEASRRVGILHRSVQHLQRHGA